MSKIIKIAAFFLFFVMCFCVKNVSAAMEVGNLQSTLCLNGKKCCKIDGVNKCVEDTGQICISCSATEFNPADCTAGTTQSKYTASGCTYLTSKRTCCDNGSWSSWGGSCPKTCSSSSRPIDTQTCVASNGKTGTQSRSVTCNSTTGEWETGSWGTCTAPDCTVGETKVCPSNSNQVMKCLSTGKWSSTCSCENPGNGKVYCMGMLRTDNGQCYHGIWSNETCSGICCCTQDTPKLMSNGSPGCWGTREGIKGIITTGWQYSCSCSYSGAGGIGGGFIENTL